MIDPAWMAWSSIHLPLWLRWAGVGILAAAFGLLTWTLRSLGTNLTDTVAIEERHLVARFGEEYQAYLSRTGRFVPRLSAGRGTAGTANRT